MDFTSKVNLIVLLMEKKANLYYPNWLPFQRGCYV